MKKGFFQFQIPSFINFSIKSETQSQKSKKKNNRIWTNYGNTGAFAFYDLDEEQYYSIYGKKLIHPSNII